MSTKERSFSINQKKIWLLIDSLTYGGIEAHVLQLAKGLKKYRVAVQVVFIAHYSTPTPLEEQLRISSIPYFFSNISFPSSNEFKSLRLAIKFTKPSLIHTHGYKANLYGRIIRCLSPTMRIKQISTYHAGETSKGKIWLYDFLDRYSSNLSNTCLAVSQSIQNKLPSSSYLLHNFISFDNITKSQGDEIAFVGRLSYEKGPDKLVKIAKYFPKEYFHCYGEGPMKKKILIDKPRNLILHGYQKDMNHVWKNIGILIICSRYEGMPMVALEAMARGIPVCAVNVGELPVLIQSSYNGFLATNDRELVNGIQKWITLSKTRKMFIRQKAIETIQKNYSVNNIIPKLLQIYQN
ncbi:glycosyltransferase [Candidatus Photodesmus blepharus]|uniref:Glycosyltransferase n=1 Tax=Candidatus Photodesmus blepharonis TaxID=1179155 RepID=A0A084CPM0_9GAMM|nr:glycosyltransferase family 4 protein [Candidatus Photodesmus blepharus]KEY91749.1 glycosyltransferase [Candidatus Photodesmus blepharus]